MACRARPWLPILAGLALLLVLLLPEVARAQVPENNILDGIADTFHDTAARWTPVLYSHALSLFWLLAVIELAWSGIRLALSGADLQEFAATLVRNVLFIGFFFVVMQATVFPPAGWLPLPDAIVESFRASSDAAVLAAGGEGGMSPSTILDSGFAMVDRVLTEASLFSSEGWALLICAILLTAVFAYIAGKVLVALIEMYVVTAGGVVLLAFGGSRFTVDFALAYLRYLVAIGAKLFFLALIIGLGQTFINDWLAALGALTLKQVLMLFGAAFVLAFIVNDIPAMVAGLIAGSSAGVGERVVDFGRQALGRAVEAPVASTPAVAASVLAVKEAASLARAQGAHGVTGTMSGAARHLASAAADDLGGQFAGVPGHQHGYRGARMAASLRAQRLEMTSPARPPESDNTLGPGKPPSGASPSGGGSAPASNPSRSRYISPLNNYGKDTDDD